MKGLFAFILGKRYTDNHNVSAVAHSTEMEKKAEKAISINTQVDDYTLVLSDTGKLVEIDNADPKTLIIPKNQNFPIGAQILVRQKGAGQITLAPVDGDVTLDGTKLKTVAQYSIAGLIQVATNVWAIFGDLEV